MHKGIPDRREQAFAAGVAAGKSLRQAAKDAGYATSTAEKKAYKIIKSARVQSFLTEALERAGVTAAKIIKPLVDGLEAKKTVAIKNKAGEIELETDYPDHRIRLEAYDRAESLYGVTLTKRELPPPPRGSTTVVIVRASDLARAQAKQNTLEMNPKKTVEVSIVKKASGPTV